MCLGLPGQIVSITGTEPLERKGVADFGGVTKEISLAYIPDCQIGDYVVVHVGFAISRIDPTEAKRTLSFVKELEGDPLGLDQE